MAWRSGQSYSEDLRERVLAAVDRGMGVYEAAPLVCVSVAYIYKVLGRRRATGEVVARPRPGRPGQKLAALHDALLARVAAQPGATLAELRGWLLAEHGVSVSTGCLWMALDRLELTHKKTRSAKLAGTPFPPAPPSRRPDRGGSACSVCGSAAFGPNAAEVSAIVPDLHCPDQRR